MKYLLGIDLGTSSLKSILIDTEGQVKAIASKSYQFLSPINGYAEHDPEEWWRACCNTIQEVMHKTGIVSGQIAGVSFSGQMHGVVMLDRDDQVIRPAILHCDARSSAQVHRIETALGRERTKELVMNPIYTGFLLPSLLWVRDIEPENYEKILHVMLPKDFLKFRMTGEISSDYSDASATLAFDIRTNCWSEEILKEFQLSGEMFPDCYDTTAVVGNVSHSAAKLTGLSTGTPVIAGGGDQVMQGIGNGVVAEGAASVNIGSSGQVSFQSNSPILNPALSTNTFCGYKKGRWITMGAIMNAGLSLKWINGILGNLEYDVLNREGAAVDPGSGGVIFLPYLNGERTPHLNPNISGEFIGLNLNTARPQLIRAVMEGVAYALAQCKEVCEGLGLHAESMVASGGGARSAVWLQIQSDIYGVPLQVADIKEQAGMGAAIAAGVGAGIYKDIEEGCRQVVRYQDRIIEPDTGNHRIYQEYYQIYKEAYTANREVLEKVTQMGRATEKER